MKFETLAQTVTALVAIAEEGRQASTSLTNNKQPSTSTITMTDEPNPPIWPDSVRIVRPTDSIDKVVSLIDDTQDPWDEEHQTYTSDHHFSSRRNAVLFAPGTYRGIDFEVGYYTHVAGLGTTPDDVQFVDCEKGPHVPALNRHLHANGTCLDTFWRMAENFATHAENGMQWAVSQAAPLRRVHVHGDLLFYDGGAYASGGHFANSRVEGHTYSGGQQQFLFKNVDVVGGSSGGAWSMVYAGCSGDVPEATPGTAKSAAVTVLEEPPVRIEKPFIAMKKNEDKFELRVPALLRNKSQVVGSMMDGSNEEVRDFSKVRVVGADDPVSRIQEALDKGLDVVLAAGIFPLTESIQMRRPNQVLLGIGMATVVAPADGTPAIRVAPGVPGIRVAGLMLEAAELTEDADKDSSTLLLWGETGRDDPGNAENPGALFDIFCRVGGATLGNREAISVDTMMRLHSGNIVAEDLWLWRADHAELNPKEEANYPEISPIYWQSEQNEFRVETGIEVSGKNVSMYGLAVEHANGHQTVWEGEHGFVCFYQCELPYGVDQNFGDKKFRGYKLHNNVSNHELHAPGVYSNL
mmetsp:Transcript_11441/g.27642  ORF Transcript_11441/g.27642 Transcript_11441/m.27642 type:complete len:579 (+) Transcript_11441:107-1843(+)